MFNSRGSAQAKASVNRQTYIPPHVEQAMNQHMQAMMPAHLKQYANGGYVPQAAQAEMQRFMDKSMPSHLKQYSGAYMQQRVVDPGNAQPAGVRPSLGAEPTGSPLGSHPPLPNLNRRDHSMPGIEQAWVNPNTLPNATPIFQPDTQGATTSTASPASIPPQAPVQPGYEFLLEPPQPPTQKFATSGLPGGSSLLGRAILAAGGLLVLVIVFGIIKGALSHNNLSQYVGLAEDQQALVHLATNAVNSGTNSNNLSPQTQNFAYTAELALTSAQNSTLSYVKGNKGSVNSKDLTLKISAATDHELTSAATNNTYDTTFRSVMHSALNQYISDLKATYQTTTGPHGKALLRSEYAGAQLLLTQLNSADS